ncbi:hypothetical protein Sjap_006327 [Stephania japonica]|uniref:WAT1-related protein n=1 Tax=Stephania japonica TaxID=461633 RepID=A0AAP0PKY4_9MAGN
MVIHGRAVHNTFRRFKPHVLMVFTQIGYTFLYFITEASFNHGMNPHVHLTYRHAVSGLVMLPFAYVLERKVRPKLTLALFAEIFVLSLLGVGLTLNMYFASLKYTSPTFIASMINTIASLTFVIAVWQFNRSSSLNLTNIRSGSKLLFFTEDATKANLEREAELTKQKGPVFVTMFNPLGTVLVAILAYFVLGEKLYTGSIVGGAIVITGMYLVLWGKEGDPNLDMNSEQESRLSYEEQLKPRYK